jgi:hypothetical protein
MSAKFFIQSVFTNKDHSTVDSNIIVERIQKVMKLVTVEGNYSELMTYKDFDYVNFPGFRKDAIVKVNAKVSVGYNLGNMKITSDEKTKTIVISNFPKPEILSTDTDIKFENLNTGWFTSFSEAEMTKLNQLAKQKIKEKALNAELIKQAEEQKNDVLDLIFYMAKENGYKIIIEGNELKPINLPKD